MIDIQNTHFFVFVNLHYQERLHLFQEGDFCFICMQISCFHLNRKRLIQKQSLISHVFQFSNENIVVLNKKHALFRPAPVSYRRGYYFENQGLMFLKFMFLICGTLLYQHTKERRET